MTDIIGGFFGTKGKKLTYGLTITGVVARKHISTSVRKKRNVEKEFNETKGIIEAEHDIERGLLNQEKLNQDAGKFIAASSKIFFYNALILRRELHEVGDVAEYIVEIEKILKKAGRTKEVDRLKKLDGKLIQEMIFEEEEEKSELKALFGLERQAKGKAGVEFFFKTHKSSLILDYIRKYSMRHSSKVVGRDEKRIENNAELIKKDLGEIRSGKVDLDKEAHKVEDRLDAAIGEIHDELKNSHKLVFNNWMNLQFVIAIVNGDIKLTNDELKSYELPVALGHLNIENLHKVLEQANKNLGEEQKMLNQIYRETVEAEKELEKGK